MQTQLTLAEHAQRNAIAQAECGSPEFCALAYEVLLRVMRQLSEFSSLDVWVAYCGPEPNHPRAMGAVFARARRERLIERTGRRIRSGRASDHNLEISTWRKCVEDIQRVTADVNAEGTEVTE